MRQGEIDNCLVMTNSDRCLFPLREGGRHHDIAGAAAAFDVFLKLANREPANLEARWLLNLSAMLLGRHPDGVPARHRLPADLFRSKVAAPRFTDVARDVGVGTNSTAGGTVVDDFDGDGLLDIVLTSVDYCAPARLFHNKGDGTFEDRTEAAGPRRAARRPERQPRRLRQRRRSQSVHPPRRLGNPDAQLAAAQRRPRRLHRRDQGGGPRRRRVRDALGGLGGLRQRRLGRSLRRPRAGAEPALSQQGRRHLRGHVAQGRRRRRTPSPRASPGATTTTTASPTSTSSNMFGDNFLYHNNGDGTFEEVGGEAGRAASRSPASRRGGSTTTTTAGSICSSSRYPNSVEEFVKHYLGQAPAAETLKLYRNDGHGGFTDVSAAVGVARVVPSMGANVGDIDNDGFLDVYLGHGRAVVRIADPEHPAAQRRRPPLRRRHRGDRHRAPAEGPRRRLRRPRSRRRPGHRAQRRRRRPWRSLRRRGIREPRHARPALGRPAADRRPIEPGGDRREESASPSLLFPAAGAPARGCAIARCRAAARSARTATSSTSAWAPRRRSSRSKSPGRPARPARCSGIRQSTPCWRSRRAPRRRWSDHTWPSVSVGPAARHRPTSTDRRLLWVPGRSLLRGSTNRIRDCCTGRAPGGALPSPVQPRG